jgi:uncharacterized membrane protein YheB (UPF0754 family)
MSFEQIAPFVLPPLLGAIIGYVTNSVAIRMLFRPLYPWKVWGIRVPMTPGIIPAKRGEMAERMGEVVGSHLFTSEDVALALDRPSFRLILQEAVSEKLGSFLDRELGTVETLVPVAYRARLRDLLDLVLWKTEKALFDYLESEAFEGRLREYLRRRGEEFLSRDLESFLTPERYEELRHHAAERIGTFLQSEELGRLMSAFIDGKIEEFLGSDKPLRDILPEDLPEILIAVLRQELPELMDKFGSLLYDPDFRERLIARIKEAIEKFLDSLAGFSGLFAGFVNMEKLYARIPEFLDQAGEEIARWLKEDKTQQQIVEALRARIDSILDQPPGAFVEKLPYEKVAGTRRFVRQKIVDFARSRKAADLSLAALEKGVYSLKDRPFRSLLGKLLPAGGIDRAREALADAILEALRSREARKAFRQVLSVKLEEWVYRRPLGKLSARLPADLHEELEDGIYLQVRELLKKEIPPLMETLNIRNMVEEKVNSLEIIKVENLLMSMMREHFVYINLFGALLGFCIGMLNLFF